MPDHIVLNAKDLPDGSMRGVEIDGAKFVLARIDGQLHAIDGTCPHYGAPLAEGTLCGHRLRCPWHQGCFDVRTGNLLEPPPLVGLHHYAVRQQGDDIVVTLPGRAAAPPHVAAPQSQKTFAIVGHGAAGECAAQTLREIGFDGRVVLIDPESHLPYDRPALSKNYLRGIALDHPLPLQPEDFYQSRKIERLQATAKSVDLAASTLQLDNQSLKYDALLLAPGAHPRKLNAPGENLRGVFMLRSFPDCDAIVAAAQDATRAVVIGSGFIGMEASASLRQRGIDVTLISPEKIPLASKLGEPIGRMFYAIHQKNGVSFRLQRKVTAFAGPDHVRSVTLDDGSIIETDFALVAVGVRPATDFLKSSIPLHDDAGVNVDRSMRVAGQQNVYAAGDIARFPSPQTGDPIRIEHWRTASQLGRVAAFNMAGAPTTFDDVPYFWTFQFDVGLDYVGHAARWDETLLDGNVESNDFLAFYLKGDRVAAVSGCNRSRQTNAIAELMRQNKMPSAAELRRGFPDWLNLAGIKATT